MCVCVCVCVRGAGKERLCMLNNKHTFKPVLYINFVSSFFFTYINYQRK